MLCSFDGHFGHYIRACAGLAIFGYGSQSVKSGKVSSRIFFTMFGIHMYLYVHIQCNLSYPGSLGPRGARNCESARKYESSTTYVDFETFNTLNIPLSLISFKH